MIDRLREIVEKSNNIVFFGGAGVSTESNIPDFRSDTGLYTTADESKYPPEYMLSHTCFEKNTRDFYRYYKSKMIFPDAKPNKAHLALAKLEDEGRLKAVITQNIDGLHQLAGSKNVFELHGSVHRNYCTRCHKFFTLEYVIKSPGIPRCDECDGIVKPDVVLYEESLDSDVLTKSNDYISQADVLIVGGTSLTVYPAAGLIEYYKGKRLVLINKSETQYDNRAILSFNEQIGDILSKVVD